MIADYYEGALRLEMSNFRAALRLFRSASRIAERSFDDGMALSSLTMESVTLQNIGAQEAAVAKLQEALLKGHAGTVCQRADLWVNLGWLRLSSAKPRDSAALASAAEPLAHALDLYKRECKSPADLANTLTNLAILALKRGELRRAVDSLRKAKHVYPQADALLKRWWLSIEGDILLAQKQPLLALRPFEQLATLAKSTILPGARWEAAMGRAKALEALKRTKEAVTALEEARAAIDEDSLFVPLGEGRGTFSARSDEASRREIALLSRGGDVERAAEVARISRRRMMATLDWFRSVDELSSEKRALWQAALSVYRDERELLSLEQSSDWKLPRSELEQRGASRAVRRERMIARLEEAMATVGRERFRIDNELRKPRTGELFLVIHPLEEGWVLFAINADATTMHFIETLDLHPAQSKIESAAKVILLAHSDLSSIDLHRLPFQGAPLDEQRIVTYGMDLAETNEKVNETNSVLVVVDPIGDLPNARIEGSNILAVMKRRGAPARMLEGSDATGNEVKRQLSEGNFGVFHYAGHAMHEGLDGWWSTLLLANREPFGVADVLALSRVPPIVVLSACEGGKSDSQGSSAGLGLAQAFLLAGARKVVAAVRPVGDDASQKIMDAFYTHDVRAPDRALREARRSASSEEMSAFRVFER